MPRPRAVIVCAALALVAAAPQPGPVVNGTTRAQRAAHPDLRFASRAEATANCERGTVRLAPGGGYSCSSAGRPIVRSVVRRHTR